MPSAPTGDAVDGRGSGHDTPRLRCQTWPTSPSPTKSRFAEAKRRSLRRRERARRRCPASTAFHQACSSGESRPLPVPLPVCLAIIQLVTRFGLEGLAVGWSRGRVMGGLWSQSRRSHHQPCRLAQRSSMTDTVAMKASRIASGTQSVSSLTITFMPTTDEVAMIGRVTAAMTARR